MVDKPRTLLDKIWDSHLVEAGDENIPDIIYIDLHLAHEVTTPQAFSGIRHRGIKIMRPNFTFATLDHSIPTKNINKPVKNRLAAKMIAALRQNTKNAGILLQEVGTKYSGIVHVTHPQLGLVQPGMTIVCGDSHTSTSGAFGCLAFGIGTSEVEMVLATQCLLQDKPKNFNIQIDGHIPPGVTAKDVILTIINRVGVKGGLKHGFEYTGSTIKSLSMNERMTICNMSIEGGARVGLIAPDDTTFNYLKGRKYAPKGKAWARALRKWRQLKTDKGAKYDKTFKLNVSNLAPRITYGTNPGMSVAINQKVPRLSDCDSALEKDQLQKALKYMSFKPGQKLEGHKINQVFIGSCTNGRLSDLKAAARVLKGKKVAKHVIAWVVPGSMQTRTEAEKLGIDKIFKEAGCEWRMPGCSACLSMNDDKVPTGHYCVSTSNRNFEGRQGKGARTLLASPPMAAAAAIEGRLVDIREMI